MMMRGLLPLAVVRPRIIIVRPLFDDDCGANKVSVYFDEALQQSSKTPYSISAAEYATLRNQAGYNDASGN